VTKLPERELAGLLDLPPSLLETLEKYLSSHISLLTTLEKDAQLQIRTNLPIAYAIDYQMMFTYAYPQAPIQ